MTSCPFTFSSTSANVNNNTVYIWNFGDGSPEVKAESATHNFPVTGVFSVKLTVINGDLRDSTSKWVASGNGSFSSLIGDFNKKEFAVGVLEAPGGGFLSIGNIETSPGFWDILMVKTDKYGNVEWRKSYGGTAHDVAKGFTVTDDNSIVICGSTNTDLYLLKVGMDGTFQWSNTYGQTNTESGSKVRQTADGGLIICGTSYTPTKGFVYVLKTDRNGGKQWENTYELESELAGSFDVIASADGGYMLLNGVSTSNQKLDINVLKISSSGAKQWEKTYGGPQNDFGYNILPVSGGFVIGGFSNSFGLNVDDVYLLKIDESGTKIWEKNIGSDLPEDGHSFSKTADGGFIACGTAFYSSSNDPDIYMVKISATGEKEWDRTFGNTRFDYGACVVQTADGGYLLGGTSVDVSADNSDLNLIKTDKDGF